MRATDRGAYSKGGLRPKKVVEALALALHVSEQAQLSSSNELSWHKQSYINR